MRILLYTDGRPAAEQAASMVSLLNYPSQADVTLLTVAEGENDIPRLSTALDRLEQILGDKVPTMTRVIRRGHPAEQMLAEIAKQSPYLVAIGAEEHHRGLLHLRSDSLTHKLAHQIKSPLLIASAAPENLKKILFCTSAEPTALETLRSGGHLIANVAAEIGLLHVMSQVALRPDSLPDDLLDTAETAIQRGTREGLHLQHGAQTLQSAGVKGEMRYCLRHGLVVDQVLKEIAESKYQLLVIGAHFRPCFNRWMGILLDDVTNQLLAQSLCSVLVV